MVWPLSYLRRPPTPRIDVTGPATDYASHAGALSPAAVRDIQARQRTGAHWLTAVDRACDPWAGRNQQRAGR